MFDTGDLVMARDIKAKPQLNGVVGKVICQLAERYGVLFPEPFGEKSLKAANLQLVKKAEGKTPAREEPSPPSSPEKQETALKEGDSVAIIEDPVELEKHCKNHPSLPAWNKKKARHAGRVGKLLATDLEEGVHQVSFDTGEECWFPKEAILSQQPTRSRSPAVSALAPSYKCPIKVLCDPVDTQQLPGGMLRKDTVLQKDRKVGFNDDDIDVLLYDAGGVATKEEKEQMKRQQEEAKRIGEMLAKKRQGVVGIEKDEGAGRAAVEKEEHKRRKGLRGSYQNDTAELIIKNRLQESDDTDAQLIQSSTHLEEQIELASSEDLHRYAIFEEETQSRGELLRDHTTGKAEAAKVRREPPRFMNPADIFSSQGWSYDGEDNVTSPPAAPKPQEAESAVKEKTQPAAEASVSSEDLATLHTQLNNLTTIAEVLRGNNEELKTKYKRLEDAYEVQAKDVKVLRQNRETAKKELEQNGGGGGGEWKEKFEKLKAQMSKGYESMQALEEKNLHLIKLAKLFEAHDRPAYHRAVKLLTGAAPPENQEVAQLRKTVSTLKQANDTLEKKYQQTLRKLTQLEAAQTTVQAKNKGSSTNTKTESENDKKAVKDGQNLAALLEEEKRKHAESKRLLNLFQQKLKSTPQVEDESKIENLKSQLSSHQEKLIRVKEERDKLQKDLKKEKDRNKELRAQAQKKK